jgi:hypothetical protein
MNNNSNNAGSNLGGNFTFATPWTILGLNDASGNLHFQVLDNTCQVNISANGNPELTVNSHAILFNVDTWSITATTGAGSLSWASSGNLTLAGGSGLLINLNSNTGQYQINSTKVLGPRVTGWAAATGAKSKATFDTSTVTLPNLAARVGQIIDDLIAHGIIGA